MPVDVLVAPGLPEFRAEMLSKLDPSVVEELVARENSWHTRPISPRVVEVGHAGQPHLVIGYCAANGERVTRTAFHSA